LLSWRLSGSLHQEIFHPSRRTGPKDESGGEGGKMRKRLHSTAFGRGLRPLLVWIALAVALSVLIYALTILASNLGPLHKSDFVAFWAAGRLAVEGLNPYDPDQLFPLEKEAGWDKSQPNRWWYPPWTLLPYMLFSFLSHGLARALWLIVNLAIVFLCCDWLWRLYGGPPSYRWLAWLIGLFFYPTVFALLSGQNGVLVLLGIAGFLYFIKNRRGWAAGISLALISMKPHLVYLLWIALIFWIIDRRRWTVLLGMGFAGLITAIILLGVNPEIFVRYLHATAKAPNFLFNFRTPTFGMLLRLLLGMDKTWLQFLPSALGTVWLLFYWAKHRQTWEWAEEMPLLLLISVVTVFYTWPHDQVVLLVAVMQGAALIFRHNHKWVILGTMILYLGISALPFVLAIPDDLWKFWMAPSFLLWYWMACRLSAQRAPNPSQPIPI
jgi:hypothetical protein